MQHVMGIFTAQCMLKGPLRIAVNSYTCVSACACLRACMCVCVCARACVCVHMFAHAHVCVHACVCTTLMQCSVPCNKIHFVRKWREFIGHDF